MIEILQAELQIIGDKTFWSVWLQITQGDESWLLPATAPGTLAEAELQAHFEGQEAELWRVAQQKRYPVDVWERIPLKRLLRAFALVTLDEINILRQRAGLVERTPDQLVQAIRVKLRG